jgi:hypothetical protein
LIAIRRLVCLSWTSLTRSKASGRRPWASKIPERTRNPKTATAIRNTLEKVLINMIYLLLVAALICCEAVVSGHTVTTPDKAKLIMGPTPPLLHVTTLAGCEWFSDLQEIVAVR